MASRPCRTSPCSNSTTWSRSSRPRPGPMLPLGVGVTGSALSQGIAELERRVGVQLFERDGRRRVLAASAAGPVLAHARDVLARTRDLADWSARTRAGRAGELRVGMIDAAAVHHYPDTLRRFRHQRPDVELRLTVAPSASLLADLARGERSTSLSPSSRRPTSTTSPCCTSGPTTSPSTRHPRPRPACRRRGVRGSRSRRARTRAG